MRQNSKRSKVTGPKPKTTLSVMTSDEVYQAAKAARAECKRLKQQVRTLQMRALKQNDADAWQTIPRCEPDVKELKAVFTEAIAEERALKCFTSKYRGNEAKVDSVMALLEDSRKNL